MVKKEAGESSPVTRPSPLTAKRLHGTHGPNFWLVPWDCSLSHLAPAGLGWSEPLSSECLQTHFCTALAVLPNPARPPSLPHLVPSAEAKALQAGPGVTLKSMEL